MVLQTQAELEELQSAIFDFNHKTVKMDSSPEDIREWTRVIQELAPSTHSPHTIATVIGRLISICRITANTHHE